MRTYTEPVVGDKFFAREDVLNILSKASADIKDGFRHNIAVIGRGLVGKSSLLLHFLSKINSDKELLPIYVNIKGLSFNEFTNGFIRSLIYKALSKYTTIEKTLTIESLLKRSREYLPKSTDKAKSVLKYLNEGNLNKAHSMLWDLIEVISNEAGVFAVIVIDEFDHFSDFSLAQPFKLLGQKIMVQQKSLFIVSSSSALTAKRILSEKLSLLFGGFDILDVGSFTCEQSKQFFNTRCKAITISDELKRFVYTFCAGHPFYLSAVSDKINSAKKYGTYKILSKNLSQMIAELLFYPSGVINQFFMHMVNTLNSNIPGTDLMDILRSLLSGGRMSDMAGKSVLSVKQLNTILTQLQELGLVTKSGSIYGVTDFAFRMWVEIKSKPRNLCFDFMPKEDAADYPSEVEERIASFRIESRKNFNQKIIELVSLFKNDQFFIDERIRMLPQVTHLKKKDISEHITLLAGRSKRKWLFVISDISLTEDGLYGIFDNLKPYKSEKEKIVLIAPLGMDTQSRLIAKQKHCLVWSRKDIGRLFEFYKGYNAIIA